MNSCLSKLCTWFNFFIYVIGVVISSKLWDHSDIFLDTIFTNHHSYGLSCVECVNITSGINCG